MGQTHSELVGFGEIFEWVLVVGLLSRSYENFGVPPPTFKTHSFWVGLTHFFRVGLEGVSGVPRGPIFRVEKMMREPHFQPQIKAQQIYAELYPKNAI